MKRSVVSKAALALAALSLMTACASMPSMPNLPTIPSAGPQDMAKGDVRLMPANYRNTAPVLYPDPDYSQETSLWSNSPKSLFGDRRASQTGDILTVLIEIDEEAELQNSQTQNTSADNNVNLNALLGLTEIINNVLPGGASLSPGIDISRSKNSNGAATIRRGEKLSLSLALQVTQVLSNGYMSIAGRQDIMVNNEVRHLQVTGLVRPEDISRQNVITYDKIANAKIYYGGTGNMTWAVEGNPVLKKIKSLANL